MQSDPAAPASPSLQPSLPPDFVPTEHTKKKEKKRSRDDANIDASQLDVPKEKKKRRKHHDVSPTDQSATGAQDSSEKERQKKKKKDKGKSKDTSNMPTENSSVPEPSVPTEPLDEEAQASAAALLSAILALAATGAPEMMSAPLPPPQIHPNYPPPIVPGLQPHFIPMGAEHPLPYVPNPHMQPIPDPAAIANMGLPIADLSSGSNEDVLRALQDLDITKIAGVLKALGEAAVAANVPPLPAFPPPPLFYPLMIPPLQRPPPVNGYPAPSNAILGIPPKGPPVGMMPPTPSVPEQHGNPEHAILLSTRWLGAAKLAELVKTEGLVYKKGKFSATEEQLIHDAINHYTTRRGMTEEELQEIIFPPKSPEKAETIEFWQLITAAVPFRPIIAVYHHVRRTYHPLKQQGKWSEEEDARLKKAVSELGQSWEKISRRVGRMSSDCRDRYRNHIQNREIRKSGPWLQEEEELLTRIVTDMTIRQGKDIDNDVFWGKVSELMGGRRGRQQCRIKWTDSLSRTVKNAGEIPRWSQQDAFILVHKVDSLNVRDDTEIDWKTLSDPDWNLWSAHILQRRWLTMKRGIKGYENMTHAEIMDILRVKKDLPAPPPPPLPPTTTNTSASTSTSTTVTTTMMKKRRVTSAAAISDVDSLNSSVAGSENNPVNEDTDSGKDSDENEDEENLSSDESSESE